MWRIAIFLLVYCTVSGPGSFVALGQQPPPNILVIMTDQQNARMMSCAGNAWLKTPNIDRLAERGIRFTRAYVTNPVCSPSRFSLFTGLYPSAINMRHNASTLDVKKLEEIIPRSLGHIFKEAGYETYYGGKVHLPAAGKTAEAYGFDHLISRDEREDLAKKSAEFLRNRSSETPFLCVVSLINPHDICYEAIRQYQPDSPLARATPDPLIEAMQIPDSLTEEAFFATYCPPLPANFEPTHPEPEAIRDLEILHPFTMYARDHWTERDWRRHRWAYHRLTERVDEQIGQVLDALQRSGVNDNTIVVFTSDHGEMSASHRLEHKTVFYEESANVPLIVWFEGMQQAGSVDDQHLISTGLDLFPTLCDLSGITVPENLPGVSWAPLLREDSQTYAARDYLVMENELGWMVRDDRFKYVQYDNGNEMLTDTRQDPGEMNNIVEQARYQDVRSRLKNRVSDHVDRSGY